MRVSHKLGSEELLRLLLQQQALCFGQLQAVTPKLAEDCTEQVGVLNSCCTAAQAEKHCGDTTCLTLSSCLSFAIETGCRASLQTVRDQMQLLPAAIKAESVDLLHQTCRQHGEQPA